MKGKQLAGAVGGSAEECQSFDGQFHYTFFLPVYQCHATDLV